MNWLRFIGLIFLPPLATVLASSPLLFFAKPQTTDADWAGLVISVYSSVFILVTAAMLFLGAPILSLLRYLKLKEPIYYFAAGVIAGVITVLGMLLLLDLIKYPPFPLHILLPISGFSGGICGLTIWLLSPPIKKAALEPPSS
jgi:hypothetical protein